MSEMRALPSTNSKHVENKSSSLITREENEVVFRLLGTRCKTLVTAVVQLYLSEAPDHRSWRKRECGVLCLVKDNLRRSYFFRLFCPLRRTLIWEHEVYNNIEYKAPLAFLHTFEAEECIAAFSFASEAEARSLRGVLLEKLEAKKQKRIDRRSRPLSQGQPPGQPQPRSQDPGVIQPQGVSVHNGLPESPSLSRGQRRKGRKEKETRRKYTKADIGLPQDFRHVSHVGWDPNRGFDLNNVEDPQLNEFFVMAGVSESQLQDRETREFIYDFINRHGGIDAVKEDIHATPSPPSGPPPMPTPKPPPPVPARYVNAPSTARAIPPPQQPPPPVRTGPLPPPPPPPLRMIPRMESPPSSGPRQTGSGSSPAVAPPPPPPPPPPPLEPPMPPPPPPPPTEGSLGGEGGAGAPAPLPPVPDVHSTLMDAIKTGKALKHVEVERRPSSSDSRGDLLDQIRQGIELRSVPVVPRADRPVSTVGVADSLAGALARALAERSRVIHSSSDSSSDGGEDGEEAEDDDEWED